MPPWSVGESSPQKLPSSCQDRAGQKSLRHLPFGLSLILPYHTYVCLNIYCHALLVHRTEPKTKADSIIHHKCKIAQTGAATPCFGAFFNSLEVKLGGITIK